MYACKYTCVCTCAYTGIEIEKNSISCKASGYVLMNSADTWRGCQAKKITWLKAWGFHVSLLIIVFAMIIMVMTAWKGGDCSCDYYNMLKDVSGQQINGKEWNWGLELDDWLECTKETKNVWELKGNSYQPWPWNLTEGGFRHKKMLSRVPEKGKMLADRLVWNLRVADKILEIPVS